MAKTSQRSSERFKYGICLNDECPKCKEKTVQQIPLRKEFLCEECGKELRECPPPKKSSKTPIYIAAAAVVLIGGGVGAWFGLSGNKEAEDIVTEEPVVTEPVTTDPTPVAAEPEAVEPTPAEPEKDKTAGEKKSGNGGGSGSSNLGWGSYSGPMQGGKPHGAGGTIKVTSIYSIDLKDGRGTMLQVNPGETIENAKFENGRLRAGELHRNDGTRKWFNC